MSGRLWTGWAAGAAAVALAACLAAWLPGRMRGGEGIHFRLDDATGLEPGTALNLSGVRAGVVTGMTIDADPSRDGLPRARVDVRLTPEAAALVTPERWEIVVTTSPLPGFKADLAFRRRDDALPPLPPLPDGAWRGSVRSAVAQQMNQAFDAILAKVRALPGGGGENSPGEISRRLGSILRNVDAAAAEARAFMEGGALRRLALTDGERRKIADTIDHMERAANSGGDVMLQTEDVLRQAGTALSRTTQLLTALRRNWLFRGAFNEPLEYRDLAPFLSPPGAGGTGYAEDARETGKAAEGE